MELINLLLLIHILVDSKETTEAGAIATILTAFIYIIIDRYLYHYDVLQVILLHVRIIGTVQ